MSLSASSSAAPPSQDASRTLVLDGALRLVFIVGDPIAQVKSPDGVTRALTERGHHALCVPAHVAPGDLDAWFDGTGRARNVDGVIVTVPHKFAALRHCASTTDGAAFVGAVNTLRRRADGRWHGDMCDGSGFVAALHRVGFEPAGRRALLVGAGGAGSAIAHALVTAGVQTLAVHDADPTRRDTLLRRLATLAPGRVLAGNDDPTGFDLAVNATPMGMREGDALPMQVARLRPGQVVGCAVTAPAVPPLIDVARRAGCLTVTGTEMFACVRDHMVDFLLEA
jgi:shikimate dehydrogenase